MPPAPSSFMMRYRGPNPWPTFNGSRGTLPRSPVAPAVGASGEISRASDVRAGSSLGPKLAPAGRPVVSIGSTTVATELWAKTAPQVPQRSDVAAVVPPQRGQTMVNVGV